MVRSYLIPAYTAPYRNIANNNLTLGSRQLYRNHCALAVSSFGDVVSLCRSAFPLRYCLKRSSIDARRVLEEEMERLLRLSSCFLKLAELALSGAQRSHVLVIDIIFTEGGVQMFAPEQLFEVFHEHRPKLIRAHTHHDPRIR
ncbi:hypothetical protein KIN20_009936 [Parelaphostrongylus tenuis]|uniref:Uncharacterized protein n=1 Tax=Parelaphostrongylus tenuis TaxID=148309 RepID=A0AAD5M8V5_PARTN|nr:hypothetical protein KIN20_009936 [Parelaphostrongylus tenuis]